MKCITEAEFFKVFRDYDMVVYNEVSKTLYRTTNAFGDKFDTIEQYREKYGTQAEPTIGVEQFFATNGAWQPYRKLSYSTLSEWYFLDAKSDNPEMLKARLDFLSWKFYELNDFVRSRFR